MSSDRVGRYFQDIIDAADLIDQWTRAAGGLHLAIYGDDQVRSAIVRQFLIISEAASRLDKLDPSVAPALAPDVDCPGVRGIGNFIRHRYDELDRSVLVAAMENRLTSLRVACSNALSVLQPDSSHKG